MIIHYLQLPSLVFHTGKVLFCMFTLSCWFYVDATRLGGGANNGDPSWANSYQQSLWKHHPRWWQTHCLPPCWSQVCGSELQTHTSTHTYTITEWPLCAGCVCSRFVVPPHPVCLERGVTYTVRFEFRRYQDANSILNGAANAILLVDSVRSILFSQSSNISPWFMTNFQVFLHTNITLSPLVLLQIALMPRHSSMEIFNTGDPASNSRKQTYERYRCYEGAKSVTRPLMSDTCAKLITSMSAIINDGALRECKQVLLKCFCLVWMTCTMLTMHWATWPLEKKKTASLFPSVKFIILHYIFDMWNLLLNSLYRFYFLHIVHSIIYLFSNAFLL